jgi:uncharacterized protein YcaQ
MTQHQTLAALSIGEARRIALAAQGFHRPLPRGRVDARHFRRVFDDVGVVQMDFVNVLAPAHYITFFARLGSYDRARLDEAVYERRLYTEQWAHQASLVPVEHWPILRDARVDADRRIHALDAFASQHATYVRQVLDHVREHGPVTAAEVPHFEGAPDRPRDDWGWTVPKIALEALFVRGEVAVAGRGPDQARAFDLAERVLPAKVIRRSLEPEDAQRALLGIAARALGVATAGDLGDYYSLPAALAKPRIDELVEEGELEVVGVEGWRGPAYRYVDAEAPEEIDAQALLAPFDPLIWCRPRIQRLFDFEYKVEIFVPRLKRQWGNYVLPFLLGDRLVGRVDLEADRKKRVLEVHAAYLEPGADGNLVAESLADELWAMADWLDLDDVNVGRRGSLVIPLRGAVAG